jgi:hypothetical protein
MASYKSNNDSLRKAADDEPIFVLRAQDKLADRAVDKWCDLAIAAGVSANNPKIREARHVAALMRKWPRRKLPD